MEIYILTSKRNEFEESLRKISTKLTHKPTIIFHEPKDMAVKYYTTPNKYSQYRLNLTKVEIDDFKNNEWLLVANVYHQDRIVEKINNDWYKHIPSHYGIDYTKCEHCGKSQSNRILSHIFYNPQTKEWIQIGSTCIQKVDGDNYLTKFFIRLKNYVLDKGFGYCDDWGNECAFYGGLPNNSYKLCVHLAQILPIIAEYRKEVNGWRKTTYDNQNRRVGGSVDDIKDLYSKATIQANENLFNEVATFVKNLDGNSDFIQTIKKGFDAEYINLHESFIAFFAHKMWEDETKGKWTDKMANEGYAIDNKVSGLWTITNHYTYIGNGYFNYGQTMQRYTFTNEKGYNFQFDTQADIAKYLMSGTHNEIGSIYKFGATIKGYTEHNKIIHIGGRLSKVK